MLKGATEICKLAGITLAGGHSIENKEPIFGLAVNGIIDKNKIKRNNTAHENDLIFLTKPIGSGILATALKRGLDSAHFMDDFITSSCALNLIGEKLGGVEAVSAMTDVTGFGLLGHLIEMTDKGRISATINYQNVPLLKGVKELSEAWVYPDNTMRNWKMYGEKVSGIEGATLLTMCDPQTNGGLLFSVDPTKENEIIALFEMEKIPLFEIGKFTEAKDMAISIE